MATPKRIFTPLSEQAVSSLRSGDQVLISGWLYTARDAAHRRMDELIQQGKELPFDIRGQVIYYVGPSPARPGRIIGSAGPTTSFRMDAYAPALIARGLKGMIGKGSRSKEVIQAMVRYKAVYFGGLGGAGALLARTIKEVEMVAYEDLGTEAIRRLRVEDFPAMVVNDVEGNDLYEEGVRAYRRDRGQER
ncbi:MAG: Fe-S-containing hydro-lyase [candidate division NC10 bacterium]|nr:Fe-S-containing hydro-lyase [candidate division NC10 bacterium]